MAIQRQLANTGAILALYQHQLAEQLGQEGAGVADAVYQLSALLVKLMKEQATGRAMVSSLMLRSHLWISQPRLQG